MTMVTPQPATADSEFCWRLPKAARLITPADPEHAKVCCRYHDTYDRAGRR